MLKELLWVSYPYGRTQGEKWIWFRWFTEWGWGQPFGPILPKQRNRAWKLHGDHLHRHMGHELPSPSRLSVPLPPKRIIKSPETRFSLLTAVNEDISHHLQGSFLPRYWKWELAQGFSIAWRKFPFHLHFWGWQISQVQQKWSSDRSVRNRWGFEAPGNVSE